MGTSLRKAMGYGTGEISRTGIKLNDWTRRLTAHANEGSDPTEDFRGWIHDEVVKGPAGVFGRDPNLSEITCLQSDMESLEENDETSVLDMAVFSKDRYHDALIIVPPADRARWVREGDDMDTYEFEQSHPGANCSFRQLSAGLSPYEGLQDNSGRHISMPFRATFAGLERDLAEHGADSAPETLKKLDLHSRKAGYADYDAYSAAGPHPVIPLIVEAFALWSGLLGSSQAVHETLRPGILCDLV